LQSGSIITIIAYNHENQQFEFTGKIITVDNEKIVLDVVYGNALEHDNSPFQESEPESEIDSYDFAIDMLLFKQFLKYRQQGFDIEKCLKWIKEDREWQFIDEKF